MGDLPRLFSTSRRARNLTTVASHLWDRVIFCIEYPNGVYINKKGVVCLDEDMSQIPQDDEVLLVDRSSPAYQKLSLEERKEQVQLRRDRTNNAEFAKYYSDPDYSDDEMVSQGWSSESSSTEDAPTDEDEETNETDSGNENEIESESESEFDDNRLDSEADEAEDEGDEEEEEGEEDEEEEEVEEEEQEKEEEIQKEDMDMDMDEDDQKHVNNVSKLFI